ncbi:hypothetical protein [Laspinema olomoucense]|uniref:Uncharacterized protein n=1 Tax=Laspinema olomoucense D3b TaxID=2953688 RepID=A0ABT2NI38_9CYAN|nr:hypothetical protein [Laspinema sp. D3b]MCT7981539.1 hypothetical protein [Laspinema sp. D3b]
MVTLETAVMESLKVHKRLPRTIQKYLNQTYETSVELEAIETTLAQLEATGKVQRHRLKSGLITHLWELVP